jgi:hypothetical protein
LTYGEEIIEYWKKIIEKSFKSKLKITEEFGQALEIVSRT